MKCVNYFEKKVNIQEAICLMETKINELVEMYNRVNADHAIIAAKVKELEALMDYLLGAGLAAEVKKKLEEWLADGTLAGIIGDTLDKWTERISNVENDITEINSSLDTKATKTFVTYEDFGAKLNGFDDDTQFVINCHNYANTNGLRVEQKRGIIYLKTADKIQVKTDLDLTGAELKITEEQGNKTLFLVPSEIEETINTYTIADFKEGATVIPCLKEFENSIFTISSNVLLGDRPDGTSFNRQEPFTILKDGNIIDGGLIFDYTSSSSLSLIRKSIIDNPIEIKLPRVVIDTTSTSQLASLVWVKRSNVTLKNLTLKIENIPYADISYNFKNSLIAISGFNVKVEDFVGVNPSNKRNTNGVTQGQYIVNFSKSSNTVMRNCHLGEEWGVTNSEFVKKMTFKDCTLNRIDNHFGMSDLYVENVFFVGNNSPVKVGCGNGVVTIKNCKSIYQNTSTVNEKQFLILRSDLGLCYKGTIKINDLEVQIKENIPDFTIANTSLSSSYSHNCTIQNIMPSLELTNIKVIADNNIVVYGISNIISGTYWNDKRVKLKPIFIDNIRLIGESSSKKLCVLSFRNYQTNGTDNTTILDVNIKNCGSINNKNNVNYDIHMMDIQDVTGAKSFINIDNVCGKIGTYKATVCDIVANNFIGEIRTADTSIINTLKIQNSDVMNLINCKNIDLDNCIVNAISGMTQINAKNSTLAYNTTNVTDVNLNNCVVSGTDCLGEGIVNGSISNSILSCGVSSTYTQVKVNGKVINCIFKMNGTNPVKINDSTITSKSLLLNNIVEGNTYVTDFTRLLKLIGTSYAQ